MSYERACRLSTQPKQPLSSDRHPSCRCYPRLLRVFFLTLFSPPGGSRLWFRPINSGRELNWLELSDSLAWQLIERSFSWRLRLLKAMAPLFPAESGGVILNVMMGMEDEASGARIDTNVASMLDQLLAPEWLRRNVVVRQIATRVSGFTPGSRDDQLSRLNDDVREIIQMLNAGVGDRVANSA